MIRVIQNMAFGKFSRNQVVGGSTSGLFTPFDDAANNRYDDGQHQQSRRGYRHEGQSCRVILPTAVINTIWVAGPRCGLEIVRPRLVRIGECDLVEVLPMNLIAPHRRIHGDSENLMTHDFQKTEFSASNGTDYCRENGLQPDVPEYT